MALLSNLLIMAVKGLDEMFTTVGFFCTQNKRTPSVVGLKLQGMLSIITTIQYDEKGNKTGYSEEEEGWTGDKYTQYYDQKGNKKG